MTPTAMPAKDAAVLAYYQREHAGLVEQIPLAGLKLDTFRHARGRLVAQGLLIRAANGRYQPTAAE